MKKLLFCLALASLYPIQLTFAKSFKPDNFRTPRPLPLTRVNTRTTISVAEFGAIPNDGKNDYPAFEKAFEQMKKGKVKVVIPPGIYDLFPPQKTSGPNACFYFENIRDFEISATGAEIVIHDPTRGFISMSGCENGLLTGISTDYDPLPFTQGQITEVDKKTGSFWVRIEEGFPEPDQDYFKKATSQWGALRDKSRDGSTKKGVYRAIHPGVIAPGPVFFEKVEPGLYRFRLQPRNINDAQPGDYFTFLARYNGGSQYSVNTSKQITLKDITVYTGPALAFAGIGSECINILNCKVIPKPGRLSATDSDCVHIIANRIGPWVEGCHFENQHDDAINLKSQLINILEVLGPNQFKIKPLGPIAVGDRLRLFNPRQGELIGEGTITEIRGQVITLDNAFENVVTLSQSKDPRKADPDMFINDNRTNESYVIKNNTFKNSLRRGLVLQSAIGWIENNRFYNIPDTVIELENMSEWPEVFVPYNVVVKNNFIDRSCCYTIDALEGKCLPISIKTNNYKSEPALWRGVRNIRIEDNTILTDRDHAIRVISAEDVLIRNNRIESQKEAVIQQNTQGVVIEP